MVTNEIKSFWDEEWKDLSLENLSDQSKYKISNYGRVISYYYYPEGKLLKLSNPNGYKVLAIHTKEGRKMYLYVHKLVAKYFVGEPKEGQTVVIHKDNNRLNNHSRNLMWASERERFYHNLKFDKGWFKGRKERAWSKLTESEVKIIKRKLNEPKRKTKIKVIARQFGVSEMQISRIKSGENWGNVKHD